MSTESLIVIADIIQSWIDWDLNQRSKESLITDEGTHIMTVPNWPTHGQLTNWVKVLREASMGDAAIREDAVKELACTPVSLNASSPTNHTLIEELEHILKQMRDARNGLSLASIERSILNKACDRLDVAISKIHQQREIPVVDDYPEKLREDVMMALTELDIDSDFKNFNDDNIWDWADEIVKSVKPYLRTTEPVASEDLLLQRFQDGKRLGIIETEDRLRERKSQQPDDSSVNEKDVRRRVMAAIRSYGMSHQEKADIESRTDGVMIVLGEYVLPFVRKPERESIDEAEHMDSCDCCQAFLKMEKRYDHLRGYPQDDEVFQHQVKNGWLSSQLPQWQPIETAPMDKGDLILLDKSHHIHKAWFAKEAWRTFSDWKTTDSRIVEVKAIGWMPWPDNQIEGQKP